MELPEGLEDYAQPEIGLVALAAVALLSPRVRRGLRRGLVRSLSGLLAASDGIVALARHLTPTEQPASIDAFRQQLVYEAHIEQAKLVHTKTAAERQQDPDGCSPAVPT
jgi:inactivated superfamily I helicase